MKRDREAERQAAEDKRIAAQRATFAAIPDGPAKQAFRIAVLERAFELLDGGNEGCYASDALLEFMAEKDQRALLGRYFETREEFDAAQFPAPAHAEIAGLYGYAWLNGALYRVGRKATAPYRRRDWRRRTRRMTAKP